MDKESTRSSSKSIQSSSSLKIKADSGQAGERGNVSGNRGSWIREDGAICFDNECITLKPDTDGALALTYDPDKCSCEEANSTILDALVQCALGGKGIRLEIKPRKEAK